MTRYTKQETLTWPATTAAAPPAVRNDLALIERCRAGEEVAYELLYDRFAGYIYRLAYGLLQHKEDAEEVLQDSFEYAFRKLHHYDPARSQFKTWLYRIAVSRCRNKRRRKWLPTLAISQLLGDVIPDRETPGPAERLMLNNRQARVWQALSELSPKLRETAVLRYYEGMTYIEIGQVLDIPPKTAESRMRLAHKTLRTLLQGEDWP